MDINTNHSANVVKALHSTCQKNPTEEDKLYNLAKNSALYAATLNEICRRLKICVTVVRFTDHSDIVNVATNISEDPGIHVFLRGDDEAEGLKEELEKKFGSPQKAEF